MAVVYWKIDRRKACRDQGNVILLLPRACRGIIVTEAGGSVSDFSGAAFTCYGKQILASNGALHKEMLGVLQGPDRR